MSRNNDEHDDRDNPALDQALATQPHLIAQSPTRDLLLIGRDVFIMPVVGSNAGNWSQESPYHVIAIDDRGVWLQEPMRLRLNGENLPPSA